MAPATTTTPHQTALLSRHGRGGSSLRRRRRPRHGISVNEDGADACMLSLLDRTDIDHRGLAKSFDVEYALEEAKRGFTFWQVLERERNCRPEEISGKSSDMSPWDRARRRMKYAKGLVSFRSYGRSELLDQDHLIDPPSLEDLNQKHAALKDSYWSLPIFRMGVVAAS
jgi:hypothetical protein